MSGDVGEARSWFAVEILLDGEDGAEGLGAKSSALLPLRLLGGLTVGQDTPLNPRASVRVFLRPDPSFTVFVHDWGHNPDAAERGRLAVDTDLDLTVPDFLSRYLDDEACERVLGELRAAGLG